MRSDSVRKMNEMLGKEYLTNSSGKCFVIGYKNNRSVVVAFYEPFYITTCELGDLKKGKVKNHLKPSLYGVGYVGVGDYSSNNKRAFGLWVSMLKRGYSEDFKSLCPTYKDVTVCDEWLNFQNFAAWCYSQNFFEAKDDKGGSYHLDKDGVVRGSKIYSPETCSFVPREINNLWVDYVKNSGKSSTGVFQTQTGSGSRFTARIMIQCKSKVLGVFNTQEEARDVHIVAKSEYVKSVAEKWKHGVDSKVYEALLNIDFTS